MAKETKEIVGVVEDKKYSDFKRVNEDGDQVTGRICRYKVDGREYSTFNEDIMKAFSNGDKVWIEYTETVKGDKTYFNIKNILPANEGIKNKKEKEKDVAEVNAHNISSITAENLNILVKSIATQLDSLTDISVMHKVDNAKIEAQLEGCKVIITLVKK